MKKLKFIFSLIAFFLLLSGIVFENAVCSTIGAISAIVVGIFTFRKPEDGGDVVISISLIILASLWLLGTYL